VVGFLPLLGERNRIRTWNPVRGCLHQCVYCYARRVARRFGWSFEPELREGQLGRRFRGGTVFVCSMGDLFGEWVPSEWIRRVLAQARESLNVVFFFETKNPARYREFLDEFPPNAILSTTIESNRDYGLSRAPPPEVRYEAMRELDWPRKHVSIEPVVDFDPGPLLGWLRAIGPELVSVGYDNWNSGLPERNRGDEVSGVRGFRGAPLGFKEHGARRVAVPKP